MKEEERKRILETDEYYQDGVKPQIFKTLIGKGHQDFQTGQQQDAREYFQFLLDKIAKEEKKAKSSDPGKLFEMEIERRLQCNTCKRVKYQTNVDNSLNIVAPVSSKVEKGTEVDFSKCLEAYFADSLVEDMQCAHCNKRCEFTSRIRIIKFPKVLCVTLQRFVFDDWVPKKLEIELQVPNGDTNIDFQIYKSQANGELLPGEEGFPEP